MDDLAAFTTPTLGSHIIAFDRPPFGLSQRPRTWHGDENNPYTVASGGRFGRGLLQRLGLGGQKSVLVGHSAGAPIALEMALRYMRVI